MGIVSFHLYGDYSDNAEVDTHQIRCMSACERLSERERESTCEREKQPRAERKAESERETEREK